MSDTNKDLRRAAALLRDHIADLDYQVKWQLQDLVAETKRRRVEIEKMHGKKCGLEMELYRIEKHLKRPKNTNENTNMDTPRTA